MITDNGRQAYIDGLRALAAVLQEHPEIDLPTDGRRVPLAWNFWDDDAREQMAAAARALPCDWRKSVSNGSEGEASYFDLYGSLAGLKIRLTAYRDAVCTRVVTGVSQVAEEVPDPEALAAVPKVMITREVEEVTWDCGSLLAPAAASAP